MIREIIRITFGLLFFILLIGSFSYWFENKVYNSFISYDNKYTTDSIAGHIKKPNLAVHFEWKEHKNGKFTIITNNLGFREDTKTKSLKENNSQRILITGDSHTDGVCNNSESFSNILEESMNRLDSRLKWEVINGGVGYYTFKNYKGFLKRNLFLNPDKYIVTLYTGNDFIEAIFTDQPPTLIESVKRSYYRIRKYWRFPGADQLGLSQAHLQQLYFELYPEVIKSAQEIAISELRDIQFICDKNKIELIILLLPSNLETKLKYDASILTQKLIETLETSSIRYINLLPAFQKSEKNLFWEQDLHLNTEGHKVVASILFAEQQ